MVYLSIYWKDIACCVNVVNYGICGPELLSYLWCIVNLMLEIRRC